jgi:hypothetical protein
MVAFWESPFKHFLLLDADTNVWGDVREHADYDRYDIIIDKPYYSCSEENINKFFFDTGQMKVHFPDFDYLKHQFVCTGVIFGRRDIFNIEEYKKMLNFVDKQPNLFKFGEMGFLNYMFFNSAEKGRIKLGSSNIQYIACDFDPEETEKRFYVKGNKPALDGGSTVIHWAGSKKPVAKNPFGYYPYREPMAFFRKKFLKDTTNMPSWQIRLVLWKEDKLREFLILKSRCHIKAVMFVKSIINKVKSLFS